MGPGVGACLGLLCHLLTLTLCLEFLVQERRVTTVLTPQLSDRRGAEWQMRGAHDGLAVVTVSGDAQVRTGLSVLSARRSGPQEVRDQGGES